MVVEKHSIEKEAINPTLAVEEFSTSDEKTRFLNATPSTNRGVTKNSEQVAKPDPARAIADFQKNTFEKNFDLNNPKFDWFEGRFQHINHLEKLMPIIMPVLDGHYDQFFSSLTDKIKLSPVQRGYDQSLTFYNLGENVLSLSYGGQNGQFGIYFKSTGSSAPLISSLLLDAFNVSPGDAFDSTTQSPILITRVDVAIDLRGDNAKIFRTAQAIAKKTKLKASCAGSWLTKDPEPDDAGRTLYLQHTNQIVMRIYEKGKEQIAKYGLNPEDVPIDWIRVEVQFRAPKGSNASLWKSAFARLNPKQMIETVEPFVLIGNALFGLDFEHKPIKYSFKKIPLGTDEFIRYLATTYQDKLKFIFDSNYAFKLLNALYGDKIADYPHYLQTKELRKFLDELDIEKYGEF